MNIKTIKASAIAVLAIGILNAPSVKANTFTYAAHDVLVGFHQTGNNTSDYLIDLTKLNAAWTTNNLRDTTVPLTLNIGSSLGTDFTTAFGSATPANLLWGFVGSNGTAAGNGDPLRTYYLSEPTGSTPQTTSAQSTQLGNIASIGGQYGPLTTGAVTSGTILTDSTNGVASATYPNSWSSQMVGNLGNSQLSPIETPLGNSLEFWRLPQGAAGLQSDEGTLSFSGTTITFTPTPVPEPGSALLVGFATLGALGFRRNRKSAAAAL